MDRDTKKTLLGNWSRKGDSNSEAATKDKGKSSKGRPPKTSRDGPTPPKQPRQSTSKEQLTASQQKKIVIGPSVSSTGSQHGSEKTTFKIPKRTDVFGQEDDNSSSKKGKELFRP